MIRTKLTNQVIIIAEFSGGGKVSLTKEHNGHVKLCRNTMRVLNAILQTYLGKKHAFTWYNLLLGILIKGKNRIIYMFLLKILFINSYLNIEYLIRPSPSVYLLDRFVSTKVPVTFDDFEKIFKDMGKLMNWPHSWCVMERWDF